MGEGGTKPLGNNYSPTQILEAPAEISKDIIDEITESNIHHRIVFRKSP